MINFKDYFADEYQFTLKNAVYSRIEDSVHCEGLKLNIKDQINASIVGNQLEATVDRKVFFSPESLYRIEVSFSFILTLREDKLPEEVKNIDWGEALAMSDNPCLENILSRASNLISILTSSCGQQPIVTPPSFIRNLEK